MNYQLKNFINISEPAVIKSANDTIVINDTYQIIKFFRKCIDCEIYGVQNIQTDKIQGMVVLPNCDQRKQWFEIAGKCKGIQNVQQIQKILYISETETNIHQYLTKDHISRYSDILKQDMVFVFLEQMAHQYSSHFELYQDKVCSDSEDNMELPDMKLINSQLNQIITFAKQLTQAVLELHKRGVFHLNIRLSNIYGNLSNFTLGGFLYASILEQQNDYKIIDPLIPQNFHIIKAPIKSSLDSAYVLDQYDNRIIGELYDIYGIGTVIYQLTMGKALQQPIQLKELQYICIKYGILMTQLIWSYLDPDCARRFYGNQLINQPIYELLDKQCSCVGSSNSHSTNSAEITNTHQQMQVHETKAFSKMWNFSTKILKSKLNTNNLFTRSKSEFRMQLKHKCLLINDDSFNQKKQYIHDNTVTYKVPSIKFNCNPRRYQHFTKCDNKHLLFKIQDFKSYRTMQSLQECLFKSVAFKYYFKLVCYNYSSQLIQQKTESLQYTNNSLQYDNTEQNQESVLISSNIPQQQLITQSLEFIKQLDSCESIDDFNYSRIQLIIGQATEFQSQETATQVNSVLNQEYDKQ